MVSETRFLSRVKDSPAALHPPRSAAAKMMPPLPSFVPEGCVAEGAKRWYLRADVKVALRTALSAAEQQGRPRHHSGTKHSANHRAQSEEAW